MRPGVGIVCNAASGRVRASLREFRARGRALAGERYLEVDGVSLQGDAVPQMLSTNPEVLVVIGGDGTLHAVLGHLFAPGRTGPQPAVLAVPAGTTNMSATAFGVRGTPLAALDRLAACMDQTPGELPVRARPVLKVTRNGSPPLCGMFFGAGIIARGVEYFLDHVRDRGVTGEILSGIVMARFLVALLAPDGNRLAAPVLAEIRGIPGLEGRRPCIAILVTVLDRLLLGTRPFWGKEAAPIHATVVGAKPARLWRSLWPLITGSGDGLTPADGYHSANVSSLSMKLDGPFVVDGQCYDAGGGIVSLSVAGTLNFASP